MGWKIEHWCVQACLGGQSEAVVCAETGDLAVNPTLNVAKGVCAVLWMPACVPQELELEMDENACVES